MAITAFWSSTSAFHDDRVWAQAAGGDIENDGDGDDATTHAHRYSFWSALIYILELTKLASMNVTAMRAKAAVAEDFLKTLANRRRLAIVCELLEGERSVGALAAAVGLSQSALSQHLARLRRGRLVATRRESQTIYYSLASDHVRRLIGLLYELYCAPARETKTKHPPRNRERRRVL